MEPETYQTYTANQGPDTTKLLLRRALAAIIIVLVCIVGGEAGQGLAIRHRTGILEVSSPTGTNVSISSQNSAATNIGSGSIKLRINPGTYLLMGAKNGSRGTIAATVTKGQVTQVSVSPYGGQARSAQDITFSGESQLIDAGLSVNQVDEIEQYIFQYKSTANNVSIQPNTVEPGPHNPNTDIGFTLDFDILIDGAPYSAVASYSGTEDTNLQLTSPVTGQVVFTSNSVQQTGGD